MAILNIAGLDCYVEGNVLNLPFFRNYQEFLTEKELFGNCSFCLTYARLAEVRGKQIAGYANERGEYMIYWSGVFYYVECRIADLQRNYRMRADEFWYLIDVDMPLNDEYDWGVMDDFLMLAFTYSSSFCGRVLLHASCINYKGEEGVAFIGPSGIGKSTQARLWLENIPGCSLLNDDQPALGLIDGIPYLFGTPWSGKTPCYKNERVRASTFFLMKQAEHNRVEEVLPITLFRHLLGSCSMMKTDSQTLFEITQVLAAVVDRVKAAWLENKPEREAVEMAYEYSIGNIKMSSKGGGVKYEEKESI
ncbi:hypothetical protein [Phocaeicola sp.]